MPTAAARAKNRPALPAFARRAVRALAAAALTVPLLASCYLPDRFQSEIRLSRTGEYGVYYKGDLTWLPLVKDIRQGTVTRDEIPERMAVLKRDLTRDSNFSRVDATSPGTFAVEYNRVGRLSRPDLVTFVRRNARVITLETDETGDVTISGNKPAGKLIDPESIERAGLTSRGLLRLTTNVKVIEHNADSVRPGPQGYTLYDWVIDGVRGKEPRFVGRLDPATRR